MKMFSLLFVSIFVGAVSLTGAEDPATAGLSMEQARAQIQWVRTICKEPQRYLGWPSVCRRSNGELLAVFSGDRDSHVCPWGKVQMVRSTDSGEKWSEPETICNTPLDDRDAGILEMPNKDLLVTWFTSVAYTSSTRDKSKLRPGTPQFYWRLHDEKLTFATKEQWLGFFTARSTDGGKSWEPPVRTYGSANHGPIALRDGRLLLVGRRLRPDASSLVWKDARHELTVEESRDNGRSWKLLSLIQPAPDEAVDLFHEPHAVELSSGRIVAQFRYHGADGRIRQCESTNGGASWTKLAATPLRGLPPQLIQLRNGKVVSVYGRRFDAFGEYACISDDGARSWDVADEVKLAAHFNGDLGYPATVELADGSLLTVYYQAETRGEPPCLRATKWRIK